MFTPLQKHKALGICQWNSNLLLLLMFQRLNFMTRIKSRSQSGFCMELGLEGGLDVMLPGCCGSWPHIHWEQGEQVLPVHVHAHTHALQTQPVTNGVTHTGTSTHNQHCQDMDNTNGQIPFLCITRSCHRLAARSHHPNSYTHTNSSSGRWSKPVIPQEKKKKEKKKKKKKKANPKKLKQNKKVSYQTRWFVQADVSTSVAFHV